MVLNFTIRPSGLLRISSLVKSKPLLRTIKLFPTRKPILLNKSEFRIIYDFPYVSLVGALLKSKTSITTAAVVSSAVLFCFEDIRSAAYVTFLAGACYCGSCVMVTKAGDGIVGKMYVNKEGEIKDVIISSLDSNGRRIDRLHRVEEIFSIDFSTKLSQTLGFSTIVIENSNIKYKINVVSCNFIDRLAFDFLLGLRPNIFFNNTTANESGNISNKKDENEKKDLLDH